MTFSAKTSWMKIAIAFTIIICSLISCDRSGLFEKNTTIPNMKWKSDFIASGSFDISDTISKYNLYIVLRHTDAFLYNNIWLNVGLQAPGEDSMKMQKINIQLGSDAEGWKGEGMNDIRERRAIISDIAKPFKKSGKYNFSIAQIMRDNPLLHVMSAGFRLEKASK
jgi:gliding motility-associated lipoprotein GldH